MEKREIREWVGCCAYKQFYYSIDNIYYGCVRHAVKSKIISDISKVFNISHISRISDISLSVKYWLYSHI